MAMVTLGDSEAEGGDWPDFLAGLPAGTRMKSRNI